MVDVSSSDQGAPDRRLQLLIDNIRDYAIYLLDTEGRVSSWNAGAERFKGYKAHEIVGEHFSRFYTEEDRARGAPERALATALANGTFEAEGWRVRKDGTRFWTSVVIDPVYDDGKHVGFAKITRDITDKRAAQDALLESERRFRLLVAGVRDYAIYMLDPTGVVTNWNAGAHAIKGYTADEIVGQHFSRFYTPEDRANGEPQRALATALREGKFTAEAWRVRKDGTRFWASVLIDPIRDETGQLIGFAKVTRDITERRLAQEEIERTRTALAQAQKMEAIGRLTGGVAHDFNNLLTVIRSSADLLQRPGLREEKRQAYVQAIADTADRAARLVGQLLAFARRQPLAPERFVVADRIAAMEQLVRTTLGSPVRLAIELGDEAAVVDADPNQFETAILNMVINARDAMAEGGALTIRLGLADAPPAPGDDAPAPGGFVTVAVEDTGHGIDEAMQARIFEPFFTTKPVNRGTGLGLSQVYGFAKQSGGEIALTSQVGAGTTFTLYLPRVEDGVAVPENSARAAATPAQPSARRVLLVEDNEAVGAFAETLLGELGQTVTWVQSGQAALSLLEESDGKAFDLVFTDVVMPGISGLELGDEVRRRWPDIAVVLTSGYSHVLAQEGSHGFPLLNKPYTLDSLIAVLSGAAPAAES